MRATAVARVATPCFERIQQMTFRSRVTYAVSIAAVMLGLVLAPAAVAQDKGTMGKDSMSKDTMSKDAMGKGTMSKDAMGKDSTSKDTMGKDTMAKDGMKKDEMKK
jgi:pentapeptide MXKDX repeat protein